MLARLRELQPYLLAGAFLLLWLIEGWAPYQAKKRSWRHTATNLVLTALYVLAGIGFGAANAWLAHRVFISDFGLLNWINLPLAVGIPVGILALDLAAYGGHILKHRVPLFWRFHQVHHSDTQLDVTSGFRFHPVEALISWLFLAPTILVLGISSAAILLFAAFYALAALIQHANVRLPSRLDQAVRLLLVSPGFHRVHHSPLLPETDSNYSALFSIWDHLFGTYTAPETASGKFGLSHSEVSEDTLRQTLWKPLRGTSAEGTPPLGSPHVLDRGSR